MPNITNKWIYFPPITIKIHLCTSLSPILPTYLLTQALWTKRNSKHVHIITEPIQLTWLTNDGFIRPAVKAKRSELLSPFLKPQQEGGSGRTDGVDRHRQTGGKASFFRHWPFNAILVWHILITKHIPKCHPSQYMWLLECSLVFV